MGISVPYIWPAILGNSLSEYFQLFGDFRYRILSLYSPDSKLLIDFVGKDTNLNHESERIVLNQQQTVGECWQKLEISSAGVGVLFVIPLSNELLCIAPDYFLFFGPIFLRLHRARWPTCVVIIRSIALEMHQLNRIFLIKDFLPFF